MARGVSRPGVSEETCPHQMRPDLDEPGRASKNRGSSARETAGFRSRSMAQVCEVCGKGPQFGNNISHAHNVTRRRWNVNLQAVRALVNGAPKRIRVCTSCIKSGKVAKA
jgi:large subunit ribosomal protein L28